jgi:hypothetical protein
LRNTAEGNATAEAARAEQITGIFPRFIPGKEFKKALDAIEFGKV